MSLATHGKDGVWANPVYFNFDDRFNFYFISMPGSLHMKNIEEDDQVALAIYSTEQEPNGDVWGIQIKGRAVFVKESETDLAHKTYFEETPYRRPVPPAHEPKAYVKSDAEWRMMKVVPEEIYCFDTRHFGENRVTVPMNELLN